MNDLLGRVASVLERRFLLVSFLPSLIFAGGLVLLAALATGQLRALLAAWNVLPGSVQVAALLGGLAAVWLIAGFLDSQLRNIVQLFEGYPLTRVFPGIAARARHWHEQQRRKLDESRAPTLLGLAPEIADDPQFADLKALIKNPTATTSEGGSSGGYAEERYILYTREGGDVLPTRLGNVLRAAEDYCQERYGPDYLKIWPRLAHVCSERFVRDYEAAKASVDFLLVICLLSGMFGLFGGALQIIYSVSWVTFLVTALGSFGISQLAYSSAVEAAKEYGEQMRASMDLFRFELLKQLRYSEPRNLVEEMDSWRDFERYFHSWEPRETDYVNPPSPDDAERP